MPWSGRIESPALQAAAGRRAIYYSCIVVVASLGGCRSMRPVSEPYADHVTSTVPREVRITTGEGREISLRDPGIYGDTIRGYTLVEHCEPSSGSRRATCIQRVDSLRISLDDIAVMKSPQPSTPRTVAAIAGLGVLVAWTVFFLTFPSGYGF